MRITDSEAELRRQLIAAGLDLEHLEPWEAWKGFKRFLATPMAIDDEGISVQCRREEVADGEFMVSMQWIRQFAAVEAGIDVPVRYVGIEFGYRPSDLPLNGNIELWSYDFPALADFAANVEGLDAFQRALNVPPVFTELISGEV